MTEKWFEIKYVFRPNMTWLNAREKTPQQEAEEFAKEIELEVIEHHLLDKECLYLQEVKEIEHHEGKVCED